MADIIKSDSDIKKAHSEYEKFLSDEHLQHLYLAREMYKHDEATRIAVAEDKGLAKGIKKAHLEIIKNMKSKGLSAVEISELTGIVEEEIQNIVSD